MVRSPSAGRWWLAVLGVVAVLAGVPLAFALTTSESDGDGDAAQLATTRSGSRDLGADRAPLALEPPPFSYRVTYRVETTGSNQATISTELLAVRRPFDARFTARRGAPPGGRTVSERVTRLGVLGITNTDDARTFALGPSVAGSDLRPEIALAEAANARTIERREQREIAGRRCQVWRFGGSVTAGELIPYEDGASEWADACFDATGILLEEVWVKDGVRLRRKLAELVEIDLRLDDELFVLADEEPVSFAQGNGYFRVIDPASGFEGTDWVLHQPPEGFVYVGRFAFAAPQLDPYRDPASSDPRSAVSTADVWARGPDLLVLEQGVVSGEAGTFSDHPRARAVDVSPLGPGRAILDLRANEVRVQLHDVGRQLRLFGTVPLSEIIDLARALEPRPGSGLRFLDEPPS